MQNLNDLESRFFAAKARLQAAQQESLEAATEFLAARNAVRQSLELFWPAPYQAAKDLCECGSESGYDKAAYGQYQTR